MGEGVRIGESRKVVEEWALVLSSQGISSRIDRVEAGFLLQVEPGEAGRAEELLRLTTIGMRAMVLRAQPNMLRLIEDPDGLAKNGIGFRWEYDRQIKTFDIGDGR